MGFLSKIGSVATSALSGGLTGGWEGAALGGLSGITSALDAAQQYDYQKRLNSSQMDFQKYMSDTAHQREVEDLKKAGINPLFSAMGSGATTPSGASGAAPNVATSSRALEAIARDQEKKLLFLRGREVSAQENVARSQSDYYANMAAGQLMNNMMTAKTLQWQKDNPTLFGISQFFQNMAPAISSAAGLARVGTGLYGATKLGSVGKTLGQIRHDQYERGYWRGYAEGPLNR